MFDKDVLGRTLDFSLYGMCHYCKQIKLRREMLKCKSRDAKMLAQPGKTINMPTNYKGKKHGQRTISSQSKHKKLSKEHECCCERLYCYYCITYNYDQNPTEIIANPSWICPYCQVLIKN